MPAIRPRDGIDDILIGRREPWMTATLKASKLSLALLYISVKSTRRCCFSFSVWHLGCTPRLVLPFWIQPKLLFSLNFSVRCNATTNIWDGLLRYQDIRVWGLYSFTISCLFIVSHINNSMRLNRPCLRKELLFEIAKRRTSIGSAPCGVNSCLAA